MYCATLHAEIYHWLDATGQAHFSDRQPLESARIQRTETDKTQTPAASQVAATPSSDETQILGPYSAFEIAMPGANETLTQETGDLSISLILDPPLMEGHQMTVALDETILPLTKATTQFALTGIVFGSHRLQIRIRDADGLIEAQTSRHVFHLRKPEQPGLLP